MLKGMAGWIIEQSDLKINGREECLDEGAIRAANKPLILYRHRKKLKSHK